MPSLEDILRKTKAKSEQITTVRKAPSIATEDRPYSLPDGASIQLMETGNKVATNRQQSGNKPATKWQQSSNAVAVKNLNPQQSGNQTSNTICNKVATNPQQSGNKVATKTAFSELVGLQRDIIIFICHECKNSRSRITEAITLEHMAMSLKRSTGAIRTTIQRLEKKGCLQRAGFKNGRGGWSRYELPDSIYHDVLRNETSNKLATNWQQTSNKLASQLATELATNASSSSILNIKETTTTELSDEWNFDITPYFRFGFTTTQAKQLMSLNIISATDVEQSLIEFSYDLDNNAALLSTIKTNKINFLMGMFRKGQAYVSETYRNEQESIILEMARRTEDKRKKLLEAKFMAWEESLDDEGRKKVLARLPTSLVALEKTYGISHSEVKKWYFDYFVQNIKG
jgi:predicted transcriptional regulator